MHNTTAKKHFKPPQHSRKSRVTVIKLLRKEEEFQWNTRKFLYWVNPGQVSCGTWSRFNFVLVAPVVGVYLFSHLLITQRQKPKTERVQGDEILHILKQRQSMPESNSTKLSSFSLPVRAFLFISKTTYNYLLTLSGFIVKISTG